MTLKALPGKAFKRYADLMNSHNNSKKTTTPVFNSIRLLDQLREQIRYLHYSLRTKEVNVCVVKKFIYFQHTRDLKTMRLQYAFLPILMASSQRGICATSYKNSSTVELSCGLFTHRLT